QADYSCSQGKLLTPQTFDSEKQAAINLANYGAARPLPLVELKDLDTKVETFWRRASRMPPKSLLTKRTWPRGTAAAMPTFMCRTKPSSTEQSATYRRRRPRCLSVSRL